MTMQMAARVGVDVGGARVPVGAVVGAWAGPSCSHHVREPRWVAGDPHVGHFAISIEHVNQLPILRGGGTANGGTATGSGAGVQWH